MDTSYFTKKADLASLRSDIETIRYKSNIDELEKVPSGLNDLKSKVGKLVI